MFPPIRAAISAVRHKNNVFPTSKAVQLYVIFFQMITFFKKRYSRCLAASHKK